MAVNKTKFNELLKKEYGHLKINDMFVLYRWQKTALGEEVDKLQVICNNPIGARSDNHYYLEARNYADFLIELSEVVQDYFEKLAKNESAKIINNHFNFSEIYWFISLQLA